jgi:hypothetical protein
MHILLGPMAHRPRAWSVVPSVIRSYWTVDVSWRRNKNRRSVKTLAPFLFSPPIFLDRATRETDRESVFSAPVNNRVYKITRFQFWVGLANKNKMIYLDSVPSYGGNSSTSSSLILMKTCVTEGEQSARLVHVWRGSRSRTATWGVAASFIGGPEVP